MLDLPEDVMREILARVPLTSLSRVRATCKKWNVLSNEQIVGIAAPVRKQFLGFMLLNSRVYSLRLDFHNNDCKFIEPSVNQISVLGKVEIVKVYHSKGLLLCVAKDRSKLVVWNPYLGQIRWIPLINKLHTGYKYTLGYDNKNHSHKILSFFHGFDSSRKIRLFQFEIFGFSSNSWRVLDVKPDWILTYYHQGMTLKENTYFVAQDELARINKVDDFLIGFNYTRERFGPRLPLPFRSHSHVFGTVALSCIRDEQLAVLYKHYETNGIPGTIEIWVTTKIELNVVSWTKLLKVDSTQLKGIPSESDFRSFFVNEQEKVAVFFNMCKYERTASNEIAYIIGQNGYVKSVNIGESFNLVKPSNSGCYLARVCLSYVPSLVQPEPESSKRGKRKERDY